MNENLMRQNAPHVRRSETVRTVMTDVIIALLPLYLMSFFYYGARALALGLISALCCAAFSALSAVVCREKMDLLDLTPVITGLILPLLLPADVRYGIVLAADAIAILVVKLPFGGTGNNLFNPAAVGFAAVAICWPQEVFSYPAVLQKLTVFGENAVKTAVSPAYSLSLGAIPDADLLDMLMGNMAGPMGATNILVLFACGLFLIVRRAVNWRTPAFFLLTYTALAALFPRIGGSLFDAIGYELFSGMLIFGAFFMLSEPITSPKRDFAKVLYSMVSAITVFLFRAVGGFEDGFVFALIILNVFSPIFDDLCEGFLHLYRHRRLSTAVLKKGTARKQTALHTEPKVRKLSKKAEETVKAEPVVEKAVEAAEKAVVIAETVGEVEKADENREEMAGETGENKTESVKTEDPTEETAEEIEETDETAEKPSETEDPVEEIAEEIEETDEATEEAVEEATKAPEVIEKAAEAVEEIAEETKPAEKAKKSGRKLTFGYFVEAIQAAVGGTKKEKAEKTGAVEEKDAEEFLETVEETAEETAEVPETAEIVTEAVEEVAEAPETVEEVVEVEPMTEEAVTVSETEEADEAIAEEIEEIDETTEETEETEPTEKAKKSGRKLTFGYFVEAIQAAVGAPKKEKAEKTGAVEEKAAEEISETIEEAAEKSVEVAEETAEEIKKSDETAIEAPEETAEAVEEAVEVPETVEEIAEEAVEVETEETAEAVEEIEEAVETVEGSPLSWNEGEPFFTEEKEPLTDPDEEDDEEPSDGEPADPYEDWSEEPEEEPENPEADEDLEWDGASFFGDETEPILEEEKTVLKQEPKKPDPALDDDIPYLSDDDPFFVYDDPKEVASR